MLFQFIQIGLRIAPTLLPKIQENVCMKISCKTENTSYWTHWHDPQCPHTLSIYPMHFSNCECSVEPLFSFWRQLQCIIVLSWQQGMVMELSSCTHMQMRKWLTLHNTPWMVRSLGMLMNTGRVSSENKHAAGSYTLWRSHHIYHSSNVFFKIELHVLLIAYYAFMILFWSRQVSWNWRLQDIYSP